MGVDWCGLGCGVVWCECRRQILTTKQLQNLKDVKTALPRTAAYSAPILAGSFAAVVLAFLEQ
jgi:hypothetical protein